MNTTQFRNTFPLGLVLFVLALTFYKAALLAVEMGADWRVIFILSGLDAFYFALILMIGILYSVARASALRVILWLLIVFMAFIYLVDSFVLLALDEHAPLFEIIRNAQELGVVLSFFDITAYTAITLFLVSMFVLGSAASADMVKTSTHGRTLSFADRVAAQRAIERA